MNSTVARIPRRGKLEKGEISPGNTMHVSQTTNDGINKNETKIVFVRNKVCITKEYSVF